MIAAQDTSISLTYKTNVFLFHYFLEYNLESVYTTNFEHAAFGSVDVSCKTVVAVGEGDGVDIYEVVCSVHVRSNTQESSLGFGQTCDDGGGKYDVHVGLHIYITNWYRKIPTISYCQIKIGQSNLVQ